jgi:hypothetical protein
MGEEEKPPLPFSVRRDSLNESLRDSMAKVEV